jgi:2,3-diketo-5-methylthio-1-phosphopentane phosphatase
MPKDKQPGKITVFFDFDNTITRGDVFDEMLEKFAQGQAWVELEQQWKAGRIGSRRCLKGQVGCLRVKRSQLDDYLRGIEVDPYFKRLNGLLGRKKIRCVIFSDNFDYILKTILANQGIRQVELYCNKLRFSGDRLLPSFPFASRKCLLCAHCKLKNLLAKKEKDSIIIYIGDGLSDVCPAGRADIIFAKGELLSHYKGRENCFAFRGLRDVYKYLRSL